MSQSHIVHRSDASTGGDHTNPTSSTNTKSISEEQQQQQQQQPMGHKSHDIPRTSNLVQLSTSETVSSAHLPQSHNNSRRGGGGSGLGQSSGYHHQYRHHHHHHHHPNTHGIGTPTRTLQSSSKKRQMKSPASILLTSEFRFGIGPQRTNAFAMLKSTTKSKQQQQQNQRLSATEMNEMKHRSSPQLSKESSEKPSGWVGTIPFSPPSTTRYVRIYILFSVMS
jgi:hypothetical protein